MGGTKKLLMVFVKNIVNGNVKTRLASNIGSDDAIEVYNQLLDITESATKTLKVDRQIIYSDFIEDARWTSDVKGVQQGKDLGERMKNAFRDGFSNGYDQLVLIGSDLPDISQELIEEAFIKLENKNVVFGPAQDGGYYLVGLGTFYSSIFEDKPWSQSNLLNSTLDELKEQKVDFDLLDSFNDVDTYEDLKNSSMFREYENRKSPV